MKRQTNHITGRPAFAFARTVKAKLFLAFCLIVGLTVAVGSITSYAWNFGDGTSTTTTSPIFTHVYSSPGAFTASVTETDSAGDACGIMREAISAPVAALKT